MSDPANPDILEEPDGPDMTQDSHADDDSQTREYSEQEVYERAVGLLARREHSEWELRYKLNKRCFPEQHIEQVINRLLEANYLSDARFAELYARSRVERGWGPQKIRADLGDRRVNEALVESALESLEVDWLEKARAAYQRRYGSKPIADYRDRVRRMSFLQRRGFPSSLCRTAVQPPETD